MSQREIAILSTHWNSRATFLIANWLVSLHEKSFSSSTESQRKWELIAALRVKLMNSESHHQNIANYGSSHSLMHLWQNEILPERCHPQTLSSPPRCRRRLCQTLRSEQRAPGCPTPSSPRCLQSSTATQHVRQTPIIPFFKVETSANWAGACTCSLLMASESWSAFTLQATSSWAVDAATCLAEEMSFSSLAWPWTEALAASHRLLVAAATIRAWNAKKDEPLCSLWATSSKDVRLQTESPICNYRLYKNRVSK